MTFSPALNSASIAPVFAIIKGWIGEKATQFGMWMGLDADVYRRVHDLVLPSQGGTTQIDHVLVSVYGIFVIETKVSVTCSTSTTANRKAISCHNDGCPKFCSSS